MVRGSTSLIRPALLNCEVLGETLLSQTKLLSNKSILSEITVSAGHSLAPSNGPFRSPQTLAKPLEIIVFFHGLSP